MSLGRWIGILFVFREIQNGVDTSAGRKGTQAAHLSSGLVPQKSKIPSTQQLRTKYARSTQYRAFLYFLCTKCARSTQQVRNMGSSGAPRM